ncbi:hypothetical protein PM082_023338 [Marasmius tenuissimus]|nr:hypothetical protein PM082_023338 [Marasmius tenuissimus]
MTLETHATTKVFEGLLVMKTAAGREESPESVFYWVEQFIYKTASMRSWPLRHQTLRTLPFVVQYPLEPSHTCILRLEFSRRRTSPHHNPSSYPYRCFASTNKINSHLRPSRQRHLDDFAHQSLLPSCHGICGFFNVSLDILGVSGCWSYTTLPSSSGLIPSRMETPLVVVDSDAILKGDLSIGKGEGSDYLAHSGSAGEVESLTGVTALYHDGCGHRRKYSPTGGNYPSSAAIIDIPGALPSTSNNTAVPNSSGALLDSRCVFVARCWSVRYVLIDAPSKTNVPNLLVDLIMDVDRTNEDVSS